MRVGGQQPWLERCRIVATDLHAGGVREPSDGWGSPQPEHRAWASILSVTAGAPPVSPSRTGSYHNRGGGGGSSNTSTNVGGGSSNTSTSVGGGGGCRTSWTETSASETDGSKSNDAGSRQPPPYLICRASPGGSAVPTTGAGSTSAAAASTSGGPGSRGSGGGGRKDSSDRGRDSKSSQQPVKANFLVMQADGRAGGAGGTGRSASVVVTVGQVETWALGGAATRWWARLGPKVTRLCCRLLGLGIRERDGQSVGLTSILGEYCSTVVEVQLCG